MPIIGRHQLHGRGYLVEIVEGPEAQTWTVTLEAEKAIEYRARFSGSESTIFRRTHGRDPTDDEILVAILLRVGVVASYVTPGQIARAQGAMDAGGPPLVLDVLIRAHDIAPPWAPFS